MVTSKHEIHFIWREWVVDGLHRADLPSAPTPVSRSESSHPRGTRLERALRAWDQREPDTNVKAWLFRILRNAFISRYRQELRRPAPQLYDTTEQAPEAASGEGSGSMHGGAEPEQMRRLASSEIEAALLTLSEDARAVILLDLEGFTESEVALIVGCAVGTVKSRLNRARAALRLKLADYGSTG